MAGWPTVAYEEPSFDPVGYWRGRTWVNMAYFALRGLKWAGYDELAEKGRATVLGWMMREPSNFNENYNPLTGRPLGAMYFGWSNAFAIKFVLDWDKPRAEEIRRHNHRKIDERHERAEERAEKERLHGGRKGGA